MNSLDLVIVVVAVLAAWGGHRLGLVARFTSWLGMALGLLLAARMVPWLVRELEDTGDGRLFLVIAGLLIGAAFLGQAVGLVIGARLHYALPHGRAREADKVGGAALGVLGVIVAVWLITPVMASVSGSAAELARNSSVARTVGDVFPDPPRTWQDLQRLVSDYLPSVLDPLEPAPELGPPPAQSGLTDQLQQTVAQSTVKVEALACGRVQDGSGAVVLEPGLVVTNAHVVAGAQEVIVETYPDRQEFNAGVVGYDPARDVAVLQVPGLDRPPLPLAGASAEEGAVGAVFGYPGGGDLEVSAYQVGREVTATGRDIYGANRTERQVYFLAAELRPGDSGGALVDPTGTVVGTAFAIAPDDPGVAYALTVAEVQAVLNGPLAPRDAGPCLR
ncbi:MAG: MarP family serine protease [Acidimicrobiales bacterium]